MQRILGDFNLTVSERSEFTSVQKAHGSLDICTALCCPDPWRIDRILLRRSASVRLAPRALKIDSRFMDARGRNLSDHLYVAAKIAWSSVVPGA